MHFIGYLLKIKHDILRLSTKNTVKQQFTKIQHLIIHH